MKKSDIIRQVAARYGVPFRLMNQRGARDGWVSVARQAAMYELRAAGRWSNRQIADSLGLDDHTSVIHGADVHADKHGLPRLRRVAAVMSVHGDQDALRHGIVNLGGVKRFYQFCRLTGHVTLYSEPINARGAVLDEKPDRIAAAREVLIETIGLAVAA